MDGSGSCCWGGRGRRGRAQESVGSLELTVQTQDPTPPVSRSLFLAIRMNARLPCAKCGESIHPDTAAKSNGLCMPCKGGYREHIEEGKRQLQADRAYEQSAERKHWKGLVDRVYCTAEGFSGLSQEEKTYFAVSCLIGELYNGGFDQFFSNSTGEMYGAALAGLWELEANASAGLLLQAKEVLFGSQLVPTDQTQRWSLMPTIGDDAAPEHKQLANLDRLFCGDPDRLGARCREYAISNGLYADD